MLSAKRNWILLSAGAVLAATVFASHIAAQGQQANQRDNPPAGTDNKKQPEQKPDRVIKTDAEWRKILTPSQFDVTRRAGTERAYTGAYWNNHEAGIYR